MAKKTIEYSKKHIETYKVIEFYTKGGFSEGAYSKRGKNTFFVFAERIDGTTRGHRFTFYIEDLDNAGLKLKAGDTFEVEHIYRKVEP